MDDKKKLRKKAEDLSNAAHTLSYVANKSSTIENHRKAAEAHDKAASLWDKHAQITSGMEQNDSNFANADHREISNDHYKSFLNLESLKKKTNIIKGLKEDHMDINKKFNLFLEDYPGNPHQGPITAGYTAIDDVDTSVYKYTPEFVDKLNFYLADLKSAPAINPYTALTMLRMKFNMIGIDFGKPLLTGDSGHVNIPLLKYGGKYGVDLKTGSIGRDNGWGEDAPGFYIHLDYLKHDGRWTLSAKIEKGSGDNMNESFILGKFKDPSEVARNKSKAAMVKTSVADNPPQNHLGIKARIDGLHQHAAQAHFDAAFTHRDVSNSLLNVDGTPQSDESRTKIEHHNQTAEYHEGMAKKHIKAQLDESTDPSQKTETKNTCPDCKCPMSVKNPGTCQNCDYQTPEYKAKHSLKESTAGDRYQKSLVDPKGPYAASRDRAISYTKKTLDADHNSTYSPRLKANLHDDAAMEHNVAIKHINKEIFNLPYKKVLKDFHENLINHHNKMADYHDKNR